jgi:hypothetical protein
LGNGLETVQEVAGRVGPFRPEDIDKVTRTNYDKSRIDTFGGERFVRSLK